MKTNHRVLVTITASGEQRVVMKSLHGLARRIASMKIEEIAQGASHVNETIIATITRNEPPHDKRDKAK